MSLLDTVEVTTVTVLKVLMASAIGSGISFALPEQSIKDVNFLNGNLFSPCFSLANLIMTLTWDLVKNSWVMFVFAFVTLGTAQIVGFLCARWCCSDEWLPVTETTPPHMTRKVNDPPESIKEAFLWQKLRQAFTMPSPRDYKPLYLITMGTQNTGNFPLGLLVSLMGNISWYDTAAYNQSLSVIFVYAALWTIFIWSIGLRAIRVGSRRRRVAHQKIRDAAACGSNQLKVETLKVEAVRHLASMDDLAQATRRVELPATTEADEDDDVDDSTVASVVRHVAHDMFEVNCSITTLDLVHGANRTPLVSPHIDGVGIGSAPAVVFEEAALDLTIAPLTVPHHVLVAQKLSRINLPIVASLLGIVIALVPPLRYIFHTPPLQVLVGGIGLIGDGCVPLSLLILGANLTSGGLKPLLKIDPRYLLVGTVVKTVILPAINIALFVLCDYVGLLPEDRVLRIAVWVEIIAPSPVMATVICRLEDYMAECATGLLLVQYVVAIFTTTAWLSLFLIIY